jgi:hypothetical protein
MPARTHRVGERPDEQRTNGLRERFVVLGRHVERDASDMVDLVEEPRTGINHVNDRPHASAHVVPARMQRAVVHEHAVASPHGVGQTAAGRHIVTLIRSVSAGPNLCRPHLEADIDERHGDVDA